MHMFFFQIFLAQITFWHMHMYFISEFFWRRLLFLHMYMYFISDFDWRRLLFLASPCVCPIALINYKNDLLGDEGEIVCFLKWPSPPIFRQRTHFRA